MGNAGFIPSTAGLRLLLVQWPFSSRPEGPLLEERAHQHATEKSILEAPTVVWYDQFGFRA